MELLERRRINYEIDVSNRCGCTPEHLYSINAVLKYDSSKTLEIEPKYREPIMRKRMIYMLSAGMYFLIPPKNRWSDWDIGSTQVIFMGANIEACQEQLVNFIQKAEEEGIRYRGRIDRKVLNRFIRIKGRK